MYICCTMVIIRAHCAEATERAGPTVPERGGRAEQRDRDRSSSRASCRPSPAPSMAERLAEGRGRRTGPGIRVSRRPGERQRQRHRVHTGNARKSFLNFDRTFHTR